MFQLFAEEDLIRVIILTLTVINSNTNNTNRNSIKKIMIII